MNTSEYDLVRVIADIPADRVDAHFGLGRAPRIGDLGSVVMAYPASPHHEPAFSVECVCPDGHTLWLAELFASELERVAPDPAQSVSM